MLDYNITHDNHYVPQFYLRNWSEDGRVNSEQYAREKAIMAGWHEEQIESEAQLR